VPNTWTFVDGQFSAAESELYPFNQAVVAAIRREIDPAFVPLVIRTVYEDQTGERRQFEHHGIAWRLATPHKDHEQRPITWPTTPGSVNYGLQGCALLLEDILYAGPDTPEGLPGGFCPISWSTLEVMKGLKRAMGLEPEDDAKAARQYIEAQAEAEKKEEARIRAETNYRFDHETAGTSASIEDGQVVVSKTQVGYTGEKA
jgi:hypothetical protein